MFEVLKVPPVRSKSSGDQQHAAACFANISGQDWNLI